MIVFLERVLIFLLLAGTLFAVENGHYDGNRLICDDGYKEVIGICVKLPDILNGHYEGSVVVCDDGFKEMNGFCWKLPKVEFGYYEGSTLHCYPGYYEAKGQCKKDEPRHIKILSAGPSSSFGTRNYSGGYIISSTPAPSSSYTAPEFGTTYDYQSGNVYTWTKDSTGTTHVQGSNLNTGSMWNTTINKNGSMQGFDKNMNSWSYDSQTGTYMNYGTGKTCIGKGAARSCF